MENTQLPARQKSPSASPAASSAALTGYIGGGLLLGSLIIALVPFVGQTASALIFSAALVVLAFGVRGVGSVTARRPIGTIALTLLALWNLLRAVFHNVVDFGYSSWLTSDAMRTLTDLEAFATFALALVVVVQIARVGAVPAPWKWAPAIILAVLSVIWLLLSLIPFDSASLDFPNPVLWFLTSFDSLTRMSATMLLGIIAIVLGDRANRSSVPAKEKNTNASQR
jgi:hypothetical protein